jgi:carboxylesterase
MLSLMPDGEPYFMPGGATGCLLIHGFTGTPYELRELGDCLAARGYTVHGPRLAHHGTNAADMNRSRWWDWYYSALDGWHLLRGMCDQVFVIGLSMGGLTALMLAANQPVAGVVAMSTPVHMREEWEFKLARYVWRIRPLMKKRNRNIRTGENNTAGRPFVPSYTHYPVRGIAELGHYLQIVDQTLPTITAPALLLHARNDEDVPPTNLEYIYNKIGSSNKSKLWIERGGHLMTADLDKDKVFQEIILFLEKIAARRNRANE